MDYNNISTIQEKAMKQYVGMRRVLLMLLMLVITAPMMAQISSVHGTLSDDMGPLMGATVCEVDGTGRIINSTVTDFNGNFTMTVKNAKNKLRFSYVGLKTQLLAINRSVYNVKMQSATQLKEVTITKKKRVSGNNLAVPEREISYAAQSFNMKELEGMSFTSVDEAKTYYRIYSPMDRLENEFNKELETCDTLEEIARLLNKYTDTLGDGTEYEVIEY